MADKGKKAKVDEEDGSDFDSELVLAIQKLQEVQDELEKPQFQASGYGLAYGRNCVFALPFSSQVLFPWRSLGDVGLQVNEEASDKVLEVEQKYNAIRRPVYQKRNEIIQGISDFWLTAFLSHPALSEILTDEDQKVFKSLQSLDVEDFKDVKSGYSITFTFRPNPYFEDSKLVKVFRFSDEGTTSISGTQPRWKDGMDYTNEVNHAVGMKRSLPEESFFKWFSETQQKDSSDGTHDEVAEIIREDLWPNPLKYFNNDQDDDDEDDDDDEEFDDEDGEDDEDQANGGEDEEEEDNDEDEDEDE